MSKESVVARDRVTSQGMVLQLVLLFLAAIVPYSNSLWNGFALDDVIQIQNNIQVKSIQSGISAFREAMFPGNLYRPLVLLSYAVTHRVSGGAAFPHHAVNVALHLAVVLLLRQLFARLFDARFAFWVALLFALHPLHTEVVANISGRAELFAQGFGLGFLCLLTGSARTLPIFYRRWAAAGLLLAALLSKESALVFIPLAVITLHYSSKSGEDKLSSGAATYSIPMGCAILAYFSLRLFALGDLISIGQHSALDNPLIWLPAWLRAIAGIVLLGKYVTLHIWPWPLSADYSFAALDNLFDISQPEFSLSLLGLLFASLPLLSPLSTNRLLQFCAIWYFAAFLLTSNIVLPIGTIFAERLAYLPSVGIIGIIVGTLLGRRNGPFLLSLASIAAAIITFLHNPIWEDNQHLHSYQIEVSPQSAKTQYNYAMVLKSKGQLLESEWHIRRALEIYPAYDDAAWGMGALSLLKNNHKEAGQWFERALYNSPNHLLSLNALARLKFVGGDNNEAKQLALRVLSIDAKSVDALVTLFGCEISARNITLAKRAEGLLESLGVQSEDFKKLQSQLRLIELQDKSEMPH